MARKPLLYFIAAGLFALAAGLGVGSNRSIDLGAVLLLVSASVFAWLGVRNHNPLDRS